jgi:hypothetical protein
MCTIGLLLFFFIMNFELRILFSNKKTKILSSTYKGIGMFMESSCWEAIVIGIVLP